MAIKKGGNYGPYTFLSLTNSTWAKITPILPTLRRCTLRALCRSVKKNTDSLVKGMILFDQGGGGRGGGKRSWLKVLPPVSPWSACFRLFFCCCLLSLSFSDIIIFFPGSKILAGNSPAGPPIVDFMVKLCPKEVVAVECDAAACTFS